MTWRYQYYFATERGRAGLDANRHDFAKLIWADNSPQWNFDDATFERSAAASDNPDYVAVVIHNYRWRLGLVQGEAKYDDLELRLALSPIITVPAITLDGEANGVAPATDGSSYAKKFSGTYSHKIVKGAGHNLPRKRHRRLPTRLSKSPVIDIARRAEGRAEIPTPTLRHSPTQRRMAQSNSGFSSSGKPLLARATPFQQFSLMLQFAACSASVIAVSKWKNSVVSTLPS